MEAGFILTVWFMSFVTFSKYVFVYGIGVYRGTSDQNSTKISFKGYDET